VGVEKEKSEGGVQISIIFVVQDRVFVVEDVHFTQEGQRQGGVTVNGKYGSWWLREFDMANVEDQGSAKTYGGEATCCTWSKMTQWGTRSVLHSSGVCLIGVM
jgi:hypothetical protein